LLHNHQKYFDLACWLNLSKEYVFCGSRYIIFVTMDEAKNMWMYRLLVLTLDVMYGHCNFLDIFFPVLGSYFQLKGGTDWQKPWQFVKITWKPDYKKLVGKDVTLVLLSPSRWIAGTHTVLSKRTWLTWIMLWGVPWFHSVSPCQYQDIT
jgi:hypothetical protein